MMHVLYLDGRIGERGAMGVISCPVKVGHKSMTSNNDFMFFWCPTAKFLGLSQFICLKASFFNKKRKYDWFMVTLSVP